MANVGDNIWMYGVYICPDIDVACYSLAGMADPEKGWGIEGDTFRVLASVGRIGLPTWFSLGDQDLATCLARTQMMRGGSSLTEATDWERKSLGVRCGVLPVTDDPVETRILTPKGECHLQEFWVRDRGEPEVREVRYKGASRAKVTNEVRSAIERADRVIVCPANPVTSIGPMLALPGFRKLLSKGGSRKVALSPMEGGAPFSGPAGKLMKARGIRQDSAGVAELYKGFVDSLLISSVDRSLKKEVESLGVGCVLTDTRLDTPGDQLRVAKELLSA